MSNYIQKNTICEVKFNSIEHKVSEKGNEFAMVETVDRDGAINKTILFPFKPWSGAKDKKGNVKDDATQKKEFNDKIVHIFGASQPEFTPIQKLVDSSPNFKHLINGLNTLCCNGTYFRMKFTETKPNTQGNTFAEFKLYNFGVSERLSTNPSKLFFKNTPVVNNVSSTNSDELEDMPF